MPQRVRKKRQNNNNIWESFQADRSAPVNMLDLPSVTDYLPQERTRASLREYDPGVVETISRAVGLMGGDTRRSHRFGDKVAGLADWTVAGDPDAIREGRDMLNRSLLDRSVADGDITWGDTLEGVAGAGIMGLGALGILTPGISEGKAAKELSESVSNKMARKREMGLLGPRLSHDDYIRSQKPKLKKKGQAKENRVQIRNVRENRQKANLWEDPLINQSQTRQGRLDYMRKQRESVDAVDRMPGSQYWGKAKRDKVAEFRANGLTSASNREATRANTAAIAKGLKKQGWEQGHVSKEGGRISSRYFEKDGVRIRLSDHDLPMTPERESRAPSWDYDIVVNQNTDVGRELDLFR